MSLRILISVTHLLGAGHLTRAAAIGRALAQGGHEVSLVSGGMPAPLIDTGGLAIIQLPPVRAAVGALSTLLDEAGQPIAPDRMTTRIERLLDALANARPDVLVTELFPFGRRVLAAEYRALLEAAGRMRARPAILASVRDILHAPAKPGRVDDTHRLLALHYDGVLVHGDPRLIPLARSWPRAGEIADMLHYTGYVDGEAGASGHARRGSERDAGILVSGGSSAAGLPLYRAALEAAGLDLARRWTVLVGSGIGVADGERLVAQAPRNVTIMPARPDFRDLLRASAVFVGQAGYNTVVDLLATATPAILVPFEAGGETEQALRATTLAAAGFGTILREADLSGPTLLAAAEAVIGREPTVSAPTIDRNGTGASVRLIESIATRLTSRPAMPAVATPVLSSTERATLLAALDTAQDEGRAIPIWWRDDDAVRDTPALQRLFGLARLYAAPLAVAAVPNDTEPSLGQACAAEPLVCVLVHGWAHRNHAGRGDKKAEFGAHRPLEAMVRDAAEGRRILGRLCGPTALPVFVPPWNRIAPALAERLPQAGFAGLSTFSRSRAARRVGGVRIVDTHLDPIAWRGSRGLAPPSCLVATLSRLILERNADGPIGLLMHHLACDEAVWAFCEEVLGMLRDHSAIRFVSAASLWSDAEDESSRRQPGGPMISDHSGSDPGSC